MTAAPGYCLICEDTYRREDVILTCPLCRDWNVEILAVSLIDSSGRTVIATPGAEDGAGGMRVMHGIEPTEQRRHTVRLTLRCEQGCRWSLDLNQEKGVTLLNFTSLDAAAEAGEAS